MNRIVMAASAAFMFVAGAAATFAPHEILSALGETAAASAFPIAVQLLGALYLAFAMANWMAKDSLIGGIYNRPLLLGNVLHFVAGALAVMKGISSASETILIALAAVYTIFAVLFGRMLFVSPVSAGPTR
jgi:hypothetical protein